VVHVIGSPHATFLIWQVVHVIGSFTRCKAARLLAVRLLLLLVFATCFLPMLVLGLPLTILTRSVRPARAEPAISCSRARRLPTRR
jgi:hypothetical protein